MIISKSPPAVQHLEIVEVDSNVYAKILPAPYHGFASGAFSQLNADKCDQTHHLLFKDSKYRLGLTGGERNGFFLSPFSAPFGGFSFLHEDIRLHCIEEAIDLLQDWAVTKNLRGIRLTLPPGIYHESFLAKQVNCLYRKGFVIEKTDLNFAYQLDHFSNDYAAGIWYNARKNLKIAKGHPFSFNPCSNAEEKRAAYEVIRQNREAKGFSLKMTWQEVQDTSALIPTDFFLVTYNDDVAVAAAVVLHTAPGIVQVVYWGDLPAYAANKTMNFLSYRVFEYYHRQGLRIIDIGPSTENSVPNYGLCEFKESIGCTIGSKFSFSKILSGANHIAS